MNRDTFFSIRQTEDRTHFEVCARIMCVNDPWVRYGMGYELCLQAFEGDFREIYILEIEDVLAGFAILQMTGTFKGYIQSLCLGEQWRSRGFGRKLLQFCEERILEISPNIFICVSEFNRGAIKLYDDFGFQRVGSLPDFLQPGITEWLMRKTHGPIVGYQPKKLKIK